MFRDSDSSNECANTAAWPGRQYKRCACLDPNTCYCRARGILETLFGRPFKMARNLLDCLLFEMKSVRSKACLLRNLAKTMQNCRIKPNKLQHESDAPSWVDRLLSTSWTPGPLDREIRRNRSRAQRSQCGEIYGFYWVKNVPRRGSLWPNDWEQQQGRPIEQSYQRWLISGSGQLTYMSKCTYDQELCRQTQWHPKELERFNSSR